MTLMVEEVLKFPYKLVPELTEHSSKQFHADGEFDDMMQLTRRMYLFGGDAGVYGLLGFICPTILSTSAVAWALFTKSLEHMPRGEWKECRKRFAYGTRQYKELYALAAADFKAAPRLAKFFGFNSIQTVDGWDVMKRD